MNHPSARKPGPVILITLTVAMLLCPLLFPAGAAAQPVSPAQLAGDFNFVLMSGDVAKVREMVALHPELVTNTTSGVNPPLVQAAEFGQGELVDFLVTNGADVNAHGVWGRTALFFAANNGDARLVRFLLDHHADVNARDDNQLTPLIQSIKSVEVIQLLMAHGADLNAHGGANTLFSQAVENPQTCGPGVIPFILTHGVDVTVSGEEGLYQAVLFGGDTNLVKMLVPCYAASTNPAALPLVRGAFGEALYNNRESMVVALLSAFVQQQTNALQKAVALGDDPAIRSLVATNPALVNIKDFLGWTPLHVAALTGQTAVAGRLLSDHANLDAPDDLGDTPLHWAALLGDRASVEVLLRHRAAMDVSGSFGNSPLLLALQYDHPAVAELLITNGADPNHVGANGDAPLHLATDHENVALMELLLRHGAHINALRSRDLRQSALDIAVAGHSPEAVRLLIANGAGLGTQMQTQSGAQTTLFHPWAAGAGNPAIADQLLAAGCDLNATNTAGQTPLHLAVGQWKFAYQPDPRAGVTNRVWPRDFILTDSGQDAARWLLDHQAAVNARDTNGQTPLHLVTLRGNLKAIQSLLEHRAGVNTVDNSGKTPLALLEDLKLARSRRGLLNQIDYQAVEAVLLQHGATGPVLTPKPDFGPVF